MNRPVTISVQDQDPDNLRESRPVGQTGGYLRNPANQRDRAPPPPGRIARRRFAIGLAKFVLPVVAIVLLGLLALWP